MLSFCSSRGRKASASCVSSGSMAPLEAQWFESLDWAVSALAPSSDQTDSDLGIRLKRTWRFRQDVYTRWRYENEFE
jgi:hypothetical protein